MPAENYGWSFAGCLVMHFAHAHHMMPPYDATKAFSAGFFGLLMAQAYPPAPLKDVRTNAFSHGSTYHGCLCHFGEHSTFVEVPVEN